MYRLVMLPLAAIGLGGISHPSEKEEVKAALELLKDDPEEPAPYKTKERREGWEMHVGPWKVTYEIRKIELIVYVHNIKESPSLKFSYRR